LLATPFATPSSWRTFTTYSLPVSPAHRREFITALTGAALAWPVQARAQAKVPVIGLLGRSTASSQSQHVAAFVQRLRELGWIEGRTITIEYRWADGHNHRFAEIAAEFVRLKVDIIVTHNTPPVLAAKEATSVIPIVFASAGDPVKFGIVASFNRPGGNVTGLTSQGDETVGKRVELLREVVPGLRRLAILGNIDSVFSVAEMREAEAAARTLGLDVAPHSKSVKVRISLPCRAQESVRTSSGMLIDVMETSKDRYRDDLCSLGVSRRRKWLRRAGRTLSDRAMWAPAVEIPDILGQDFLQVALIDDEHVVEALGPDGPHPTLGNRVGPGRSERRAHLDNTEITYPPIEAGGITAVAVVNEKAWLLAVPTVAFDNLLCRPRGGRMPRHMHVENLPAGVMDHEEHVQRFERDGLDAEEVARPDLRAVLPQE
jgi:putative tryptophan/tyrosine transport system substrate-binding protein